MANSIYQWGGKVKTETSAFKPFKFKGSGFEYFKIWIVNVLLIVLTLGIYYPWAKVRNKKYFYANSILDGRHFEYHASGKQLLIGYLIGVAFVFTSIIAQEVFTQAIFIFSMIFFCSIPWIIYSSMKFNRRMTSFSKVHFSFNGTIKESYIYFFFYPFIFLLSLYFFPIVSAIFLPDILQNPDLSWISYLLPIFALFTLFFTLYMYALMKKKIITYRLNKTHYGEGKFTSTLKATKFMMIALKTIFLALFFIGVFLGIIGLVMYELKGFDSLIALQTTAENFLASPYSFIMGSKLLDILPLLSIVFSFLLVFLLALSYIIAKQRSYVYSQTKLDDKIIFSSTVQFKSLFWVIVSNMFLLIITLGLVFPWTKVRMVRFLLENTKIDASFGMNEYLSQKRKEQSALEEEIGGDSFDLDVGIGI